MREDTISKSNFPRANKEIKAQKVRLVGSDGEMIGVVPLQEAIYTASKEGLDLVEISPTVDPPVCKILDFGKYKYEAKKKLQDSKKKQKVVVLKEIKFRPNIGSGDFDVKMRSIFKFIEEGDKVKISMIFKGREIVHHELGHNIFNKIVAIIGEKAKIEFEPKMEGKQMLMVIAPNKVLPAKIKT
ncbi:MAG: translation initiation factor IF-3 [Rickettsiaceae bacterium]|nr:translation initiation factor IF-3 [Rickettsiaceae bacterium]